MKTINEVGLIVESQGAPREAVGFVLAIDHYRVMKKEGIHAKSLAAVLLHWRSFD